MRLAEIQKQPRALRGPDSAIPSPLVESNTGLELTQGQSSIEVPCMSVTGMMQPSTANAHPMYPGPVADSHFIVLSDMTACAALAVIAQRLQLDCQFLPGFHIKALTDDLPPPIAPTSLQKSIPHRSYLDMLPWASL